MLRTLCFGGRLFDRLTLLPIFFSVMLIRLYTYRDGGIGSKVQSKQFSQALYDGVSSYIFCMFIRVTALDLPVESTITLVGVWPSPCACDEDDDVAMPAGAVSNDDVDLGLEMFYEAHDD